MGARVGRSVALATGWGGVSKGIVKGVGFRVLGALTSFGAQLLGVLGYVAGRLGELRRPVVRQVFHKQVLFTGLQALLPVTVAGLVVGVGLMTQMRALLGGGIELNVKMLQLVVLREFAPLLTAFIVLGRSGSAMATELASMKVRGELRSLYLMGVGPGDYLLVPRVAACALCLPALTFVFQLVAVLVGPVVASMFVKIELGVFYRELVAEVGLVDVFLSLSKTTVIGMVVAGTACATGCFVPPRRVWVPQAAELSVLRGFVLVLMVDLLFAAFYLLLS